jgi:NAD(P)-dependent dehydrogenase (short-subunit alcohol dehydrogenase family)
VLLKDKCGLITGAASGMGQAAASLFAAHGARIMCADIDLNGAQNTARAASAVEAYACALDVSDKVQCQTAVKQTVDRFGRIDFLAHFAGIWDGRNTADIEEEHWDRIIDVNLKGSFLIAQAVEPIMIKRPDRSGRLPHRPRRRQCRRAALCCLKGRRCRAWTCVGAPYGRSRYYGQHHQSGACREQNDGWLAG